MNKTKIVSSIATLSTLVFLFTPVVLAQTTSNNQSLRQVNQTNRMNNIKTRSDNQINFRLTSLNSALTKIQNAKKISDSDKTKFTQEIQADITDLTNLKAKIDSDTNLSTLISDAKTIFTDYRVYAIFLPQVHMLSAIDVMGQTADNLTTISGQLQTRIQTSQSQGKNVTNLTNLLNDMNSKIADSNTQSQSAESEIINLTPSNFPATFTLKDARSKIQTGIQDLKTARNDAIQILQGLHTLNGGNRTSTGSANILKK